MCLRITTFLFLLLVRSTIAEVVPFYIGTMTDHTGSKGIYLDSIDTDTGKLGAITLAVEAQDPNFLTISPDRSFLFAALDKTVGAFKVRADGMLTALNEQSSGGEGPCHVSLDETGRHLFVANYGGGSIACLEIGPTGLIGVRTALVQFTGSGPAKRQNKSYAHSAYLDPENKFLYSCDLGSDSVWIFKFSGNGRALVPTDPPAAKIPPGSGPRHLTFSSDGHFVYVVNEMGASVTVFRRDAAKGTLTLLETISALLPGTPSTGVTAAEICFHPSGKWLYVSNRGCDVISVFTIASDGSLSLLQNAASVAKFPRSFALDPTGQWLIVAGQKDNRIAVLKIDQATGRLTDTGQTSAVDAPVCVLFAPGK
jgi:6-phosphogluconolactonase